MNQSKCFSQETLSVIFQNLTASKTIWQNSDLPDCLVISQPWITDSFSVDTYSVVCHVSLFIFLTLAINVKEYLKIFKKQVSILSVINLHMNARAQLQCKVLHRVLLARLHPCVISVSCWRCVEFEGCLRRILPRFLLKCAHHKSSRELIILLVGFSNSLLKIISSMMKMNEEWALIFHKFV